MDLKLKGKVAFVAGSSGGIGKAIACEFLSEGCRVVITGRDAGSVTGTVDELREWKGADEVMGCPGDLSSGEVIEKILGDVHSKWTWVDCLVANVGSGSAKSGWQLSETDWTTVFDHNFSVSRRLVDAMVPQMIERRSGSIVFVSSIAGIESISAPLTYSAAKAALVNYSKNLSRMLGPYGVRVNCVAPGNILFPGGTWERKLTEEPERFRRYIEAEVPLRRFGTPEEIAALVAFISSERAAFITGACIVADGGQIHGY
jgi:3-oxoacyl-[acyl-carrier protein] reductase